jgi:uncharacterized protein YegP (UPF0339 family)
MSAETVEFYRDTSGEWRWRAIAGNQEVVADSSEGYVNRGDAETEARNLFGSEVYYRIAGGHDNADAR